MRLRCPYQLVMKQWHTCRQQYYCPETPEGRRGRRAGTFSGCLFASRHQDRQGNGWHGPRRRAHSHRRECRLIEACIASGRRAVTGEPDSRRYRLESGVKGDHWLHRYQYSEGHRVFVWATILLTQSATTALSWAADSTQQPKDEAHVSREVRRGSIVGRAPQTITVLKPPGKDLRPSIGPGRPVLTPKPKGEAIIRGSASSVGCNNDLATPRRCDPLAGGGHHLDHGGPQSNASPSDGSFRQTPGSPFRLRWRSVLPRR